MSYSNTKYKQAHSSTNSQVLKQKLSAEMFRWPGKGMPSTCDKNVF